MNAIECDKLTRRFGRTQAVADLNLAVPTGSIYALLGPNGAGKTTTLRLLLNLLRPTSGRAHVLGKESTRLQAKDFQRIGYLSEEQIVPGWMTLRQLLAFCQPLYPQWDAALARRLRRLFDLPDDRPLKKLSRGMRMKAALLSTLAYRTELLVLDEPFSGLDPLTRDEFVQGLLELPGDDRPRTVLISTHDIDDIERLADHVGFLSTAHLLLSEPADALRARFRRIEISGDGVSARVPTPRPAGWEAVELPSANCVRLVHSAYAAERTPAELETIFPGAQVIARPMTVREIFLALARSQRGPQTREAA